MFLHFGRRAQVSAWFLLCGGLAAWWSHVFFFAEDKTALLPGETSHGHHQVELKCSACHDTTPEGLLDSAVSNQACLNCHKQDMEDADDSHPPIKFKKPENRPFLEKIDARNCVTCHTEHKPDHTAPMGVTVPADYCMHCHQSTVEERETHKGLTFNTCATSGCHNFHDNRALYERHLAVHSMEPANLAHQRVPDINSLLRYLEKHAGTRPLTAADADAPPYVKLEHAHVQKWVEDAHSRAAINCSDCHQPDEQPWQDRVEISTCAKCHSEEHEGFLRGKHGMRLAAGLSPMSPDMARRPMHAGSAHRTLSCTSCHGAHDFDTQHASYKACIECHNDTHTKEYENYTHHQLWKNELAGLAPAGSGVSCATCHMPRLEDSRGKVRVEHNQNSNLTPNEKMLRPVCQQCHGLPFAIDALADRDLILRNFSGKPGVHNESTDWARQRAIERNDREVMELIRKMSDSASSPPETENSKPKTNTEKQ